MDIHQIHEHFLNSSGICTDTRKIEPNCMFFALKGENFNGNEFAAQALEKGAKFAVIDEPSFYLEDNQTLLCQDSLQTLQALANYHRKYLGIPIISLTGSNGKTTTKELIQAVLSQKYNCVATQGNLNNHIGVPLTLLSMNASTELGIVEMGANHIGEIAALCEIAEPNYGYITNFGKAHLEGFGSLEGVVKGKSELYNYIGNHPGTIFVNGDDPKQMELTKSFNRVVFNGPPDSLQISQISSDSFLKLGYKHTEISSQLMGAYNFTNIAAAIAIGAHFRVSTESIARAIQEYRPQMNRSQILEQNGHTIMMDAYNANPSSMMAALQNFNQWQVLPKALILGDMFELGTSAKHEHQMVVDFLKVHSDWKVFLVGLNFYGTQTDKSHLQKFRSFEDFRNYLKEHPLNKSHILIKGSRGMALERILPDL